jgi:hypothetical protein
MSALVVTGWSSAAVGGGGRDEVRTEEVASMDAPSAWSTDFQSSQKELLINGQGVYVGEKKII